MSISTKPASGTRDFLPVEARRRRRVFAVIETTFESYGFSPLETPAMERLTTLMGKYGDEGDQLIFKILQRGEKLTRALDEGRHQEHELADMGLRYDLTVPLARVVAQYRNELPRIFRRYQIAPVWRADRPQKGRFREFYQCDVDVVGASSMMVEVEVISALSDILLALGFHDARIHVNHRGVLRALVASAGIGAEHESDALIAIDKLDKVGEEGVLAELVERGISEESSERILSYMRECPDSAQESVLEWLHTILGAEGKSAVEDLEELLRLADGSSASGLLRLDPFLARGLSYYTGPIFEIRSDAFSGSLGGGGRYDGLIGMFGKEEIPACGFSLGVERILMLMDERDMWADEEAAADVMVTTFSEELAPLSIATARTLRDGGLRVELYPEVDKLGKQFKHADSTGIEWVISIGPSEAKDEVVSLKQLQSGQQWSIPVDEALQRILG